MERLHAAKRIEALLMQESTATVINANSLWQVVAENKRMNKVELTKAVFDPKEVKFLGFIENREWERLKKAGLSPSQIDVFKKPLSDNELKVAKAIYESVEKLSVLPEIKDSWREFTQKIATSGSRFANRELLDLIHSAQHANVFEEWLNFSFADAWAGVHHTTATANIDIVKAIENKTDRNAFLILQRMRIEMNATQDVLNKVSKAKERLNRQKEMEGQWADPNKFEQLSQEFTTTVLKDIFELTESLDKISKSEVLAHSTVMAYLREAVDVYDKSIKTMCTSMQCCRLYQRISSAGAI